MTDTNMTGTETINSYGVDYNRAAIERRHSEFDYARRGADKSFYAACADRLIATGWQWMNDWYKGGWWILPGSEHERPMGDPNDFYFGAFNTVQLFTALELDEIKAVADDFRRDARRRSLERMMA